MEKKSTETTETEIIAVDFIHFCHYAFLDNTGHANVMGIFTQLTPDSYPFPYPALVIAVGLRHSAEIDVPIGIQLCTADGTPQRSAVFRIHRPKGSKKEYSFIAFQTVALAFAKPVDLLARVVDERNQTVLGTKTLRILPSEPAG